MIQFVKCTSSQDINDIHRLAHVIWNEHYLPIIGQAQIDYMIEQFQSIEAITKQIQSNFDYYLVITNDQRIGYFSYQLQPDHLFLSKLYILNNQRGRGIAAKCLEYLKATAVEQQLTSIKLTVNKKNDVAIEFYHKVGFITIEELVLDIGNGYVMDDYLLLLEI